jgi:hypothetical protein
MKLHRDIMVQEMTGPIPYELTLREIITAGDSTNHYHIYVLALLSEFFKNGLRAINGQLDGLPPLSSNATSVGVIESIKSLTPSEKVNLATYLLACVEVGESALHSTQMSSADWIRFVLQRQ